VINVKIESRTLMVAIFVAMVIGNIELWTMPSRIVSEQTRVQAEAAQRSGEAFQKQVNTMFGGK
jgi:hypothetical protein